LFLQVISDSAALIVSRFGLRCLFTQLRGISPKFYFCLTNIYNLRDVRIFTHFRLIIAAKCDIIKRKVMMEVL
jgi:hypothetical protein